MTHMMYDSQRIIPAAPSVSIQKQYQKTSDGTIVGAGFSIIINGVILADHGSPASDGSFWTIGGYPPDETIPDSSRLMAILRKQEAMRKLFSVEGRSFEIQSADGSPPIKCNPRIIGIDFGEGLWYQTCPYTITLECDVIYINGTAIGEDAFPYYIIDASENWSIEVDDTPEGLNLPKTYRMSHSVSATGKRFYDDSGALPKKAWERAKDYVLTRLGFSQTIADNIGVNNLSNYNGYNYFRSSSQDELAGQFSITENWLLATQPCLEEFSCEIKKDSGTGITSVGITGTLTGLEIRDADVQLVTSKYENASNRWTTVESQLLTRAQLYSGLTLNPIPLTIAVGKNDISGVITYSYEFDTRPTNLFSDVSFESITLSESFPSDLFAIIPVIGRSAGPVLQYLSSVTERTVSLSIELVANVSGNTLNLYNNPRVTQNSVFQSILAAAEPSNHYGTSKSFVNRPNETWDYKSGRYTYSIEWVFGN